MGDAHFVDMVRAEQGKIEKSVMEIPAAESHRIATAQGKHAGLTMAIDLYRRAMREDVGEAA